MPCYYCANFSPFFSFILDEKKLEISHSARERGSGQGKKMFLKDDGSLCYLDHNEIIAL